MLTYPSQGMIKSKDLKISSKEFQVFKIIISECNKEEIKKKLETISSNYKINIHFLCFKNRIHYVILDITNKTYRDISKIIDKLHKSENLNLNILSMNIETFSKLVINLSKRKWQLMSVMFQIIGDPQAEIEYEQITNDYLIKTGRVEDFLNFIHNAKILPSIIHFYKNGVSVDISITFWIRVLPFSEVIFEDLIQILRETLC